MRVSMYVYMHVYVSICEESKRHYVHVCVSVNVCVCVHVYVCLFSCVCICVREYAKCYNLSKAKVVFRINYYYQSRLIKKFYCTYLYQY